MDRERSREVGFFFFAFFDDKYSCLFCSKFAGEEKS
jgi:hypothetical protein